VVTFARTSVLLLVKHNDIGKYGLSTRGPSFDPVLVGNRYGCLCRSIGDVTLALYRQNPRLAAALSTILQVPIEDVMTSHDR
jgi:hypothetical protein